MPIILLLVGLLAAVSDGLASAGEDRRPAGVEAARCQAALEALVSRGCLASTEEWRADLLPKARVEGERAALILRKIVGLFRPVASTEDAIAELTARRIITSPAMWRAQAVPGGVCSGSDLSVIVCRVAEGFWQPIPVPRSFASRPLDATSPVALADRYDVVVAGAGTGGCGAAIQAARMGCSVLLLEETDLIGGQAFAAGVTSMDEGKRFIRERGLYRELCGLIQAHYQPLGVDFLTAYWHNSPGVEPRVGRDLLLRMLADAKADGRLDLALRARVSRVRQVGDRVVGVECDCHGAAGPFVREVACAVLVDATEWGDVIPLTSARYRAGNSTSDSIDATRQIQNLTWTAVVKRYSDGVPAELLVKSPPPGYESFLGGFRATLIRGMQGDVAPPLRGEPWNWTRCVGFRGMPDGTRLGPQSEITRTHLNYNNDFPVTVVDLENRSARLRTCHEALLKTLCLLHYVQTELGCDDWSVADDEGYDTPFHRSQVEALIGARPELASYRAVLRHFPTMPYVRESRRIVGLHTLTARDIERRPGTPTQFSDTVALADYPIDLHGSMTPENLELEFDRLSDIPKKFGERGVGPFAVPFRCFIPETVDGFLVAEKNISQSRLANGATRLQPSTLNMGQTVGVIAALAVKQRIQPRAVDPANVQRVLLEAGCPLAIARTAALRGSAEWIGQQRDALREGVSAGASSDEPVTH